MKTPIVLACAVLSASFFGCSSEGDILPSKVRYKPGVVDAGSDGVATEAGPDVSSDGTKPRDPNANCVKPGTPNNERDIGGYCEPGRGDCASEQGPRFCTADFTDIFVIDEDKWFCSTVCVSDDECGTGALCAKNGTATGCAPVQCIKDGGTGSSEAGP